jgi:hypothetical protein
MHVNRQANLLQIVRALDSPRSFPRLLNGRQKQTDKNTDNRYDDQQFHQRKSDSSSRLR